MRTKRLSAVGLIASVALGLCLPAAAYAQSKDGDGQTQPAPMTPEKLREVLLVFVDHLGALSLSSGDLSEKIAQLTVEEMQVFYDAFPDPVAFSAKVDYLGSIRLSMSKGGAFGPAEQHASRTVLGVLGINPGVDPFLADYPSPGGAWFALLGFLGLANDERCDPDFEAGLLTAIEIARIAATFAQATCDTIVVILGEGTNAPFCGIAAGLNAAADAADFILQQCQVEQAAVDSAEIEAAYENSLLIFEGLRCVGVSQERMGQGCNGEDDNCDKQIDECTEDTFGPLVFIDQSVTKCCYDDAAEAAAAVALAVKAWDDCGSITISPPDVQGDRCDVAVEVTATDDCGNATTASTVVTIDGDGPSVTIDPAVADVCYASIDAAEQAVLDATTIMDNCDSLEDLQINVHSSVTECALRVRLEVTDKCGNTTTVAITVRVDPHVPLVDIQVLRLGFRGEVLGFQTPVCYETIAEAEQAVLAVTYAEDNCTVSKELVTSVSSAGDSCSLLVTTSAVDECGNENTDSETVRVDAEDPMVTCGVMIGMMSPPNHTMRNVGFVFTATDNCTGEPEIEIFVTSDETTASADGTGKTTPAPDAFILRDLDDVFQGILLRAERSTDGDGRVYEITVRATDECGNVGQCSANVSVSPANGQPAVDSGQFYDATEVN